MATRMLFFTKGCLTSAKRHRFNGGRWGYGLGLNPKWAVAIKTPPVAWSHGLLMTGSCTNGSYVILIGCWVSKTTSINSRFLIPAQVSMKKLRWLHHFLVGKVPIWQQTKGHTLWWLSTCHLPTKNLALLSFAVKKKSSSLRNMSKPLGKTCKNCRKGYVILPLCFTANNDAYVAHKNLPQAGSYSWTSTVNS